MSDRMRPEGDEIIVSLESGANCESANEAVTDAEELGFSSRAEWDAATDEEKLEAVQEYFYASGYPEWSWDDGTDN